jgi:hypothetical protein
VLIEGTGPPNTPLLLYFNNRAVGGTTSDDSGFYSLTLVIGEERDGAFPLEVQVRGSRELVAEFTCTVPESTPTPTWPRL